MAYASSEGVNDTWFFTWNSIPPKRPSILASFVSKITRNTAIGRYRKKNAQKRTDSHMEDIAGEVEKIGNIIASDIETYLRKKEIIDIFDAFLGTLSERDRDIFVRRYWYMDSIKKIADRQSEIIFVKYKHFKQALLFKVGSVKIYKKSI